MTINGENADPHYLIGRRKLKDFPMNSISDGDMAYCRVYGYNLKPSGCLVVIECRARFCLCLFNCGVQTRLARNRNVQVLYRVCSVITLDIYFDCYRVSS